MHIGMGIGRDILGTPVPPADIVAEAVQAEAEGFASAWTVHFTRGVDALSVLAVAGTQTSHIDLAVGIVPSYPRHPFALAQQAATTQALCGGRLTLGVGVSHRPVIEGIHGLNYHRPAAHMREYLWVLGPLLRDGAVSFQGEFFKVEGAFTVPGTSPVSVVVGALSPKMVRVAGECADGAVTWLAGPRILKNDIVPALARAAADAGRPPPRVIAAVPVAVCDDADDGRAAAEQVFGRYGGMENYQRLFAREGVASPGATAVLGSESEVEKQLSAFAEAGATELWPTVFPVGNNSDASLKRTRALLAELARR